MKLEIEKVKQVFFLTSGQALFFDKEGNQVSELQSLFASGQENKKILLEICEHAEKFTIGQWRVWTQELSKQDFIRLLHLNY